MIYKYDVDDSELHIALDAKKNHASLLMDEKSFGSLDSHAELSKGKIFITDKNSKLFIKLINLREGFTVMINNKHVVQSAGHPKKLMRRTLLPILLGVLIITLQFSYVVYDLFAKGEMQPAEFSLKTIVYLSYFFTLLLTMVVSYFLARKGKWQGAAIAFFILLINLLFSIGFGLYYDTGTNLIMWFFFVSHTTTLLLIYSHLSVIKYVRQYTRDLSNP